MLRTGILIRSRSKSMKLLILSRKRLILKLMISRTILTKIKSQLIRLKMKLRTPTKREKISLVMLRIFTRKLPSKSQNMLMKLVTISLDTKRTIKIMERNS